MNKPVSVTWSVRSLANAKEIITFLDQHFSPKEVDKFKKLLVDFERTISYFPEIYPLTKRKKGIRKAVLSKRLIAYYTLKQNSVLVVALQDNRQLFPK